jgi:hypothetical protein
MPGISFKKLDFLGHQRLKGYQSMLMFTSSAQHIIAINISHHPTNKTITRPVPRTHYSEHGRTKIS